jgi:nitronate monooxygenase/enoyl-[acyl-carrier protein] reductase II
MVSTVLFDLGWPEAPHRVLRHYVFDEWGAAGCPASGQRPGEGTIVGAISLRGMTLEVPQYGAMIPVTSGRGDMKSVAFLAGESCTLVHNIKPAAQIVHHVVREAEETITHMCGPQGLHRRPCGRMPHAANGRQEGERHR